MCGSSCASYRVVARNVVISAQAELIVIGELLTLVG